MKERIEQIIDILPKDKNVYKVANLLISNSEDLDEAQIQENLNDLLFTLYILNEKETVLQFQEYFLGYEITSNKNIWTWIESSLTLMSRINRDFLKIEDSVRVIEKIKTAFNIGSEMAVKINSKARQRRLDGDDLLYDRIEEAIANKNIELEYDYRMVQLKKLLFISELGFSESMPESKVENEIIENMTFLNKNIY
ncbi:DUF6707 family protein [Flavobacterium tructae]|uniref:Uncharacterized protein n=1 Tax=Flavobacterium tructae TaxID=1114873 RepID=A0A1S1JCH8_9FLAO|nr:DUF6707 family protein [Flavobacterium tructae]OHT47291.1 hypothetical protein BHE19_20660 [Flavobacterium tructae]OXB14304.1 hypothetical protein B0A71_21940 [Flavobacterium tructae]OXB20375.1 hypothetical protein B0A80_19185 [Flavobacterium tructae]